MTTISISNGAAQAAYQILSSEKPSKMDELFVSGTTALKFKPAMRQPAPGENEKQLEYLDRIAEWLSSPFPETDIGEDGKEYLRSVIRQMVQEKRLVGSEWTMELAASVKLNEK